MFVFVFYSCSHALWSWHTNFEMTHHTNVQALFVLRAEPAFYFIAYVRLAAVATLSPTSLACQTVLFFTPLCCCWVGRLNNTFDCSAPSLHNPEFYTSLSLLLSYLSQLCSQFPLRCGGNKNRSYVAPFVGPTVSLCFLVFSPLSSALTAKYWARSGVWSQLHSLLSFYHIL